MKTSRVILITGTSRGIGRGLAEHFLGKGDTVCGCSRSPAGLTESAAARAGAGHTESAAARAGAGHTESAAARAGVGHTESAAARAGAALQHPRYEHFELEIADEKAVVAMVREVVRRHGRIDALLNNAGIAAMNHALLTPAAVAQQIMATNFHGTFLFCREVAKAMVRRKVGRIVNFTTVATPLRLEGEALYAASKAAVESFTQVLARELGASGVTVNAVGPTPVPTDLIKNVPAAKLEALLARQAIRRLGTVEDVVNVVEFFLADSSEFVTGQVLYLGGVNG